MQQVVCKFLNIQDYLVTLSDMQNFTKNRDTTTVDEIWFVEHPAVFTLGKAAQEQHILYAGDIPVVKSDRGGQVTYHGPGQLVIYFLLDLARKSLSLKKLIYIMQQAIIDMLHDQYNVIANVGADAPGVYVLDEKICSIGLKIYKGCSYHGLSLNVNMDLKPFTQINPCGVANLQMTQLSNISKIKKIDINCVAIELKKILLNKLDYLSRPISRGLEMRLW